MQGADCDHAGVASGGAWLGARHPASPSDDGSLRSSVTRITGDPKCETVGSAIFSEFGVIRFAGLPSALAMQVTTGGTMTAIADLLRADGWLNIARRQVCERLEVEIPVAYAIDPTYGKRLLHLKRHVHNLRDGIASAVDACPLLDQEIVHSAQRLAEQIAHRRELLIRVSEQHADELAHAFAVTRDMMSPTPIRRALQLASPNVFASLDRAGPVEGKKGRSTAFSIARYALRASRKTSPRNAFGPVARCVWTSVAPPSREPIEIDEPLVFACSLRQAPFQQVAFYLVRRRNLLRGDVAIRLNETAHDDGTVLRWATNPATITPTLFRSTYSTLVSTSPSLRSIARRFGGAELLTLDRLSMALAGAGGTAVADTLMARLLSSDLFQVIFDDVDQQDATAFLQKIADLLHPPVAELVRARVADLRAGLEDVSGDCSDHRSRGFARIAQAHAALRQLAGLEPDDAQLLIQEDCFAGARSTAATLPVPTGFLDDLERFLRLAPLLGADFDKSEGARLARLFVARFGANGICTDVSSFLSEVTVDGTNVSELATGHADARVAGSLDPLGTLLLKHLAEGIGRKSDFAIDPALVEKISSALPPAITHRAACFCVTYQLAEAADGATVAVMNKVYPGPVKMLSRFLPDDMQAQAAIQRYLTAIHPEGRVVALPNTFGFNANVHPQICDHELELPPHPRGHAAARRITLSDCSMRYDSLTMQIYLADAEGERLHPYYFGILLPTLLPKLHRLLDGTSSSFASLETWLTIRLMGAGDRIQRIPRITFGTLVVCRRTMIVPPAEFPDPAMEAVAFFLSVQHWRTTHHDLARHVFCHIRAGAARGGAAPADDKPLPLDLDSPLSVAILQRAVARHKGALVLVEALPGAHDTCVKLRGEAVASEYEIEIALPGSS